VLSQTHYRIDSCRDYEGIISSDFLVSVKKADYLTRKERRKIIAQTL